MARTRGNVARRPTRSSERLRQREPRARGGHAQPHGEGSLRLPVVVEVDEPAEVFEDIIEHGGEGGDQDKPAGPTFVEEPTNEDTSPENAIPLAKMFALRVTRGRVQHLVGNAEPSCDKEATVQVDHKEVVQAVVDDVLRDGNDAEDEIVSSVVQQVQAQEPLVEQLHTDVGHQIDEANKEVVQSERDEVLKDSREVDDQSLSSVVEQVQAEAPLVAQVDIDVGHQVDGGQIGFQEKELEDCSNEDGGPKGMTVEQAEHVEEGDVFEDIDTYTASPEVEAEDRTNEDVAVRNEAEGRIEAEITGTNDGVGDVSVQNEVDGMNDAETNEETGGGRRRGRGRGRGRGTTGRGRGRGRRGRGRHVSEPQQEDIEEEVSTSADSSEADEHVDDVVAVGVVGLVQQDSTLLKSFDSHVAHSIAQGDGVQQLRIHHHATMLKTWVIDDTTDPRFRARVINSGLLPLAGLGHYKFIKHRRVSAFVERWYPETNSFHFDFGEMTITLDDVLQLTGLPVTGAPLFVNDERDPVTLLVQVLGVSESEAKGAIGSRPNSKSVALEWLAGQFSKVGVDADQQRVDYCTRAYLMYILGCTIFTGKEGARVPVRVLSFLADLDGVRGYAWGAAALAVLYRELGYASRKEGKQIAGFLTLLETWIDEHFPCLNPLADPNYTEDLPRSRKWCARKETGLDEVYYRHLLDDLAPDQVIFDPYSRRRRAVPPIAFYTGPIRAMAVVEPHLPDRVLRQFGLLQVIPAQPIGPERDSKKRKRYDVNYAWMEGYWDSPEYHSVPQSKRVRPTVPWGCSSEYKEWFKRVSHPRVDIRRGAVRRHRDEQIAGVVHMAEKALQQGREQWRPALEKVVQILGYPSEREIADRRRRVPRAGSV